MELRLVSPQDGDYLALAERLDAYYFELVGDVQRRYAAANDPKGFACRIVAYEEGRPAGIGCWKALGPGEAEVKRIYVLPEQRRKGVASAIIRALEADISAQGIRHVRLETAATTPDSAALYLSLGYHIIDYYGSPAGAENCLCFGKDLSPAPHP